MKSYVDLCDAVRDAVQDMTPARLLWWVEVESAVPYFESQHCVKCLIARYLASVVRERVQVGAALVRVTSDSDIDFVTLPYWAIDLIHEFDDKYAGDVPRQVAVEFLKSWL